MIEKERLSEDAYKQLVISLNRYQSLLEAVNGVVWEADADTFTPTFVSDSVTRILGYTPDEWYTPGFWESHIYHEDREAIRSFYRDEQHQMQHHNLTYRMVRADGSIVWIRDIVSVVMEQEHPRWLRGIMIDITETKLLADLDHLEKEVLELNSGKSTEIETVLNFYVLGIERLFPKMKCSVLRVNGTKLNNWASPSLPEAYAAAIKDKEIGPYAGSCGAAAYKKERVIVNDIAHDEIWAAHKEVALAHNFRASWSYPIINSHGEVIATFGIYYEEVTTPDESQTTIIERSAEILRILLENRLYAATMQEIAWLQSHVIRAPLARLMGLVDLLRGQLQSGEEHLDLLNKITDTAKELDGVIHNISDNALS